jgi:hypothetical protein
MSASESLESSQNSTQGEFSMDLMNSNNSSRPLYKTSSRKRSQQDVEDMDHDYPRQRSAPRDGLYFVGQFCESGPWSRIRVWMSSKRQVYYDCVCARRVPIQHLKKIKHHAESHDVNHFVCETCGRQFDHYLKRNAHQKFHKRR